MISSCQALSQERQKLFCEYFTLCKLTRNCLNFENFLENEELTCQFNLDPTSLNLPERVSPNDPILKNILNLSRDFCYLLDKTRLKLLKEKEANLKD